MADLIDSGYIEELSGLLAAAGDNDAELLQVVVDAPFRDKRQSVLLSLGVVVFLLVNPDDGMVDRVALSRTEQAEGTIEYSALPFNDIRIPLTAKDNIIVQAIESGEYRLTDDWKYLFTPALTAQQARFNQAGGGIGCSVVYPLPDVRDGAAMIFSYFVPHEEIGDPQHAFMRSYTELVTERLRSL